MKVGEIIPHGSVFMDADFSDLIQAIKRCFVLKNSKDVRQQLIGELCTLFTNRLNPNYVLPCLCVRSGFDLFLRLKNFPVGSEVIMSAINIPDMIQITKEHKLHIIPVDICPETLSVDPRKLEELITNRTVAIIIAHIYGKWMDVNPLLSVAKKHGLYFIEDCAEAFCGLSNLGHPESDLSMYSFGVIKVCTCFSGSIIKVKDADLYNEMKQMLQEYDVQTHTEFMKKLFKYVLCFISLNCSPVTKSFMSVSRFFDIDHQKYYVKFLRGFPDDLIGRIRKQPSVALLGTMLHRIKNFNLEEYYSGQKKMRYVARRLPPEMKCVGIESSVNNFWLFPVIVKNVDTTTKILFELGVDAYKGCTQLDVILPPDLGNFEIENNESEDEDKNNFIYLHSDSKEQSKWLKSIPFPHQAKDLIDHVIYLPVHRLVSYRDLDKMCMVFYIAVAKEKLADISSVTPSIYPSKL